LKIYMTFEGRKYELPIPLDATFREARMLKRFTGLRMGEFEEALQAGDAEAFAGAALIAFHRDNPLTAEEKFRKLDDVEVGTGLEYEADEEEGEDEASPPDEAASEAAADEPVSTPRKRSTRSTTATRGGSGTQS
jgi:hypothetical protein